MKEFLSSTIKSISGTAKSATSIYDLHIRKKAIKKINEKMASKGLQAEQIKQKDYEVMVNELSKYVKEDYAKNVIQWLLTFISAIMTILLK